MPNFSLSTMSHASAFQAVVEQNNKAVALIEMKRFGEAVTVLTQTLRCSQQELQQPRNYKSLEDEDDEELCNKLFYFASTEDQEEADLLQVSDMEDSPFLFCQPLSIRSDAAISTSTPGLRTFAVVSFVLVFNLALTYNLAGLHQIQRDSSLSTKRLGTALRLYELAFELQSREGLPNPIISAAIVNNLALVHKSLKNEEKSEQCYQLLVNTLFWIADNNLGSTHRAVLDRFLGNVMHLIMKKTLTVALAA
jgi:tetratricopeptide (TPR) repeat protein